MSEKESRMILKGSRDIKSGVDRLPICTNLFD